MKQIVRTYVRPDNEGSSKRHAEWVLQELSLLVDDGYVDTTGYEIEVPAELLDEDQGRLICLMESEGAIEHVEFEVMDTEAEMGEARAARIDRRIRRHLP